MEKDESLKEMFNDVLKRVDKINNLVIATKNNYFDGIELDIPNIGTQYNNKLVELVQIYEKNGLSFCDSELFYPISAYFLTLINKGIDCLNFCNNYITKEREKITYIPRIRKIIRRCEERINEYITIDNTFYKFDLEKNIIDAVKCYASINNKISRISFIPNVFEEEPKLIDKYNNELKILGINTVIDESIIKDETTEYTDIYDKKILKRVIKKRFSGV